jgi:hypothetical protein
MILSSHYGEIVAVFGGTFVVAYLITRAVRGNGKKYLPSLPHVPVLGSLPFMPNVADLPEFFMEKAKSLGKAFTFYMGSR